MASYHRRIHPATLVLACVQDNPAWAWTVSDQTTIAVMLLSFAIVRWNGWRGTATQRWPSREDWARQFARALCAAALAFFFYGLITGLAFWLGTDYPYFLMFTK